MTQLTLRFEPYCLDVGIPSWQYFGYGLSVVNEGFPFSRSLYCLNVGLPFLQFLSFGFARGERGVPVLQPPLRP